MNVATVRSSLASSSSENVLKAFAGRADIVVLEYPSGRAHRPGPWCHVFFHHSIAYVAERLWHEENWHKVNPLRAVFVCLYAPLSAEEVIGCIRQNFDNVVES